MRRTVVDYGGPSLPGTAVGGTPSRRGDEQTGLGEDANISISAEERGVH